MIHDLRKNYVNFLKSKETIERQTKNIDKTVKFVIIV